MKFEILKSDKSVKSDRVLYYCTSEHSFFYDAAENVDIWTALRAAWGKNEEIYSLLISLFILCSSRSTGFLMAKAKITVINGVYPFWTIYWIA